MMRIQIPHKHTHHFDYSDMRKKKKFFSFSSCFGVQGTLYKNFFLLFSEVSHLFRYHRFKIEIRVIIANSKESSSGETNTKKI